MGGKIHQTTARIAANDAAVLISCDMMMSPSSLACERRLPVGSSVLPSSSAMSRLAPQATGARVARAWLPPRLPTIQGSFGDLARPHEGAETETWLTKIEEAPNAVIQMIH